MAAYISIDFSKLRNVSVQATALGRKMDTTKDELIALQEQLRETQNYLEKHYDACWDSVVPVKRLRTQAGRMDDVVSVLSAADNLAKGVDDRLKAKANLVKLTVAAVGSVSASAKTIVAKLLTGESDCGDGWCGVADSHGIPATATEASTRILERDTKIMQEWEVQDEDKMWCGYYKRNDKDKRSGNGSEVNCRWFTRKKVTALLGSSPTHDSIRKQAGQTITAADGTEYLVTKYSYAKASDLVKSIQQPAQNIVLNFNGHAMMIDYIIDGKVYFSDNAYKRDWVNGYLANGQYPNQCMTLDDFGKWYDQNNGNLVWAYSLTPQ